jgi:putative spermidine/putrescine transport system permease protein
LTVAGTPAVATRVGRPVLGGRRISLDWLGTLPFFVYVAGFLILPTAIVGIGAFLTAGNSFTLDNYAHLSRSFVVKSTLDTTGVSAITAVLGAFLGALLAYAIATGNPQGVLRRVLISASGVLAQFGGVTLAFAFIASIGPAGFVYLFFQSHGADYYAHGIWLFDVFPGLVIVYLYFQIPLMVLVFLPALDGLKPQWREATESLGGNTWHYWRYVAGPILFPAFLGGVLLLFANAFSAYATANALINQGAPMLSQQISNALSSEVGAVEPGFAKAIAIEMIVIVTLVTVLYSLLQRRTARWL